MSSTSQIEPFYVVDTHPLIWYLMKDKRLSRNAQSLFLAAERDETRFILSSISIAEMFYANQKVKLFDDFNRTYTDLRSKPYLRFVPFRANDVLGFAVDALVPEMHDRIITGLARRLGAPLMTADPLIISSKLVPIAW